MCVDRIRLTRVRDSYGHANVPSVPSNFGDCLGPLAQVASTLSKFSPGFKIKLTPPPAAVFSWFQIDKSKTLNSSLKMSSPLQISAGALVPMAVVTDGKHSACAAAIVQTSTTRVLMLTGVPCSWAICCEYENCRPSIYNLVSHHTVTYHALYFCTNSPPVSIFMWAVWWQSKLAQTTSLHWILMRFG